ncbi:MAG TPA: hypothetical protein VGJ07_18325 [Rugosimonospora sp.]
MALTRRQVLVSTLATSAAGLVGGTAGAAYADSSATTGAAATTGTGLPALTPEYKAAVDAALNSNADLWGNQLLARPEGPTYENIKDLLKPLMYAGPATGGPLTLTGVHYLPFGMPSGLSGRGSIALHVADGSQIITNRSTYRNTQIFVGDGSERFGATIGRLDGPRLDRGYLPVLDVGYVDAQGVRYTQESFATFLPGTQQLVSYVKITAGGSGSATHATVRFLEYCGANGCGLTVSGNSLVLGDNTYLFFSPGATFDGTHLDYQLDLSAGEATVYLVRVNEAAPAPAVNPGSAGHAAALASVEQYWDGRLAQGAVLDLPEPLAVKAVKNLLIQNLLATWRYSLGNNYEAFYQPESSDTVETLGHFGFTDVYRSALQDLLPLTKGADRRNWEIGTKLFHAADYYHLTKDASLIEENEATYVGYLEDLIAQHAADPNHLLERQQYSSDIKSGVYGLHQIGVAHHGAQNIAEVWRILGRMDLADRYAAFAADLFGYYQAAARSSQVELPDGALFTPVELLDGTQPWDPITGSTLGGYFNLVVHYGFAARVYPPGSDEARRTIQYMLNYGSRLLGLLRSRLSGDCNVYETEQLKYLADNDEADQIVLTFYGKLAHGMTRDTFVAGEAHNIGPISTKFPSCQGLPGCGTPAQGWAPDEYYRTMYLPPNTANNTAYLQALRAMLVRTASDELDLPRGLNLAYATPRGWLEQGKTIRIANFPTEFGPVGYEITSNIEHHRVHARVDVPSRDPLESLSLRLRAPKGYGIAAVLVNGRDWKAFDPVAETIDLSGLSGHVSVDVNYRTQR